MIVICGIICVLLVWIFSILVRAYRKYIHQRDRNRLENFYKRKIPVDQNISFLEVLRGTIFHSKRLNEKIFELYNKHTKKSFVGFFADGAVRLLVRDLDLIKHVLVDDFSYFEERTSIQISSHPNKRSVDFMLPSATWKTLKPLFSRYLNTKQYAENCYQKATQLAEQMCSDLKLKSQYGILNIDISDLVADYAANCTGLCVLGIDVPKCQRTKLFPINLFQKFQKFIPGIKNPEIHFIDYRWLETIRKCMTTNGSINDFISFLRNYENKSICFSNLAGDISVSDKVEKDDLVGWSPTLKVTDKLVLSQTFATCLSGFEGSRSVIAYALLEIGKNKKIQSRIHEEIDANLMSYRGNITLARLMRMEILKTVLAEVLRLHSPISTIIRKCVKDYSCPNQKLKLLAGDELVISIRGIHLDERLWDDPLVFNPDRFSSKEVRHPCSFMPFGCGPRSCLGVALAKVQCMTALFHILKNFTIASEGWSDAIAPGHWRHPVFGVVTFTERPGPSISS